MNSVSNEWWRGAVIYQIYPRSFQDSNGDGIGDLRGIEQRLDHVAGLGVDGIWISPFFVSPMKDFGYDVSDYVDVDPCFGTLQDFDRVIDKAHRLGLKVIIDQVYSHTSDQHAWFAESRGSRDNPKHDWYVWADPKPDGTPPNNWQSVFTGPAWTWDARREQYYLHNFLSEQPDLNLHNAAVQDALLDVARFWLDRGVNGFRLDAINHGMHDPQLRDNPIASPPFHGTAKPYQMQEPLHTMNHADMPAFLERIREMTDRYPGSFTVAEIGSADPLSAQKAYTEGSRRLHSSYGFEFLGLPELTAQAVRDIMRRWDGSAGEGWPSWALSNHDGARVASRWLQQLEPLHRTRLLALLQISLRGNIHLYQGEELGLPQAEVPFEQIQDPEALRNWPQTQCRDGARTPMPWSGQGPYGGFSEVPPWLGLAEPHRALAADRQVGVAESTLEFFRRAIALRQQSAALRVGALTFLDSEPDVLAFVRVTDQDAALCVFNLGGQPASMSHAAVGDLGDVLCVAAEVEQAAGRINLPAFSGLVGRTGNG